MHATATPDFFRRPIDEPAVDYSHNPHHPAILLESTNREAPSCLLDNSRTIALTIGFLVPDFRACMSRRLFCIRCYAQRYKAAGVEPPTRRSVPTYNLRSSPEYRIQIEDHRHDAASNASSLRLTLRLGLYGPIHMRLRPRCKSLSRSLESLCSSP